MEVSRIDENGYWIKNYDKEFLERNIRGYLDGDFIINFILTDIVYDGDFFLPKLVGEEYIEDATLEYRQALANAELNALKVETYNLLTPTDWYFTRKIETNEDVPINIINNRETIRENHNTQEQAILTKYNL